MSKINYVKESKYYKYRLRCCSNCDNEQRCNEDKIDGSVWLSAAKCGCHHYTNPSRRIMREKPFKRGDD